MHIHILIKVLNARLPTPKVRRNQDIQKTSTKCQTNFLSDRLIKSQVFYWTQMDCLPGWDIGLNLM